MGRTVIHPLVDRMFLGYGAAVLVAAYSGTAGAAIYSELFFGHGRSLPAKLAAMPIPVAVAGTMLVPITFLAGLPVLAVAGWLAMKRGIRSPSISCMLGILGSAIGAFILLPMFTRHGDLSRDLSDPGVWLSWAEGLAVLAPAGALAGWVFDRIAFGRAAEDAR